MELDGPDPTTSGHDADYYGDTPLIALPGGTILQRYEIVRVLGEGAFGITYLARDSTLGREVAIKEYLPASLAIRSRGPGVAPRSTKCAPDFLWGRDRFLAEAQTLAKLDGVPAVVRVLEYLEANGTAYMVMGLARGETLRQQMTRAGSLEADRIERILWPLLDGLQQVHATGYLHRDIKPSNIIVDAKGLPTLIDFGASRVAMADRTAAMTAVFTPGYAALEQFVSSKQGPWTDIYGLSATLYHAISGTRPPHAVGRTLDDTYRSLAELAPKGFGRSLLAGIDAGMAVRPPERPQSIAAWREQLSGRPAAKGDTVFVRQSEAMGVAPPAITSPARSLATKPPDTPARWLVGLTIAAASIVLAGGGYFVAIAIEDQRRLDTSAAGAEKAKGDAGRRLQEEAAAQAAREEAARAEANKIRQEAERARAEEARRKVEAEAQQAAEEAAARRRAEAEKARQDAELARAEEARRKVEAEVRQAAEEAAARQRAEAEKARQAAERARAEEARRKAEAEARQAAEEAAARQRAEAEKADRARAEEERRKAENEARAKAAQAAETALGLGVADRQRIQIALTSQGFDTLGADGFIGQRSRQMIAAWQKARGLPETGFLPDPQYQALLKEGAQAIRQFDDAQRKAEEERKRQERPQNVTPRPTDRAPDTPAPTAAAPAPANYDGAWTLVVTPSSGPGRLCTRGQTLRLNVSRTFAPTPIGPVFISEAGGVSGTLRLDDGAGFKGQIVLQGSISGAAGSGRVSGICEGTFTLSRG